MTPNELAVKLGVKPLRIRNLLRKIHGLLEKRNLTRWDISPVDERTVRIMLDRKGTK